MNIFLSLLAVLFIGLKLSSVITWSWWLVLLPLYGGLVLGLVLMLIAALIALGVSK
jgi:hypothetical protein